MLNKEWLRNSLFFALTLFFAVMAIPAAVFAVDGGDEDGPKAQAIADSLSSKRVKSPAIVLKQRVEAQMPKPVIPAGKTKISEVSVVGSTILAPEAINKLKAEYENRELSARQIQMVADTVTRAYTREGYITSFGVVNTDKLSAGILEIQVSEGRTGKIIIEGNQTFSTEILRKKVGLQEGDLFNFKELNNDLYKMNKHPDRKVALTCDPNVATGFTDITLTVKDKSPLHVTLQTDNYGSEFINYRRYKTFFTNNNLTGHDDSITFKAQLTEGNTHKLYDADYFLPLNRNWKLELYYMPYKKEDYVGSDNPDTDFEKHAHKWYFWFYQSLVDQPDFELSSQYGYVQKDIHWWKYGRQQSSDLFRALMWGLDFNRADKYGRWVISNDLEIGIPRLFGGSTREDDSTSVKGAGSGYKKNHLVIARRQKLFNGIDFITKGHWQLSNQSLTGVNVFSVGGFMGVIDDRGYPRAQAPGDSGQSLMAGFTFPPFGVSRSMNVPGSKTKMYDAIKLFTFMDWAKATLKNPQPTDAKRVELASAGFGFTFTVPDKSLSTRVDVGWPLTEDEPKDGDSPHIWWCVTKGF
ncbi:MAG TPA: POTRA domain-containing protein [Candidatus Omnitrophota bacterium]|nr:POTRA domain-containing protein [Candidatus Omnitrophota bacterium]HRZ15816.1 POTRA domain-containing protein [Candidatus Omnitrophota bacterium]